jgi:hypothetical protein
LEINFHFYVYGRAETNIKPWKIVLEGMVEGNKKIKWQDREPYAYWRGNPHVSPNREDLMKCNVSDKYDWLARLYEQASFLDHSPMNLADWKVFNSQKLIEEHMINVLLDMK